MKALTMKKIKGSLIGLLAVMTLFTTACQKSSSGNTGVPAPVPPMYPGGCTVPGCGPGGVVGGVVGGVPLYGGATTNSQYLQIQFQVSGDPSGTGMGSISGVVNVIQPYLCSGMMPGSFPLQATQAGTLQAGIFSGYVMLGNVQAAIQTVPGHPGLMTIAFPTCSVPLEMNF